MRIGLALERDVAIGIAGLCESIEPLDEVEDVEGDVPELTHLGCVNALMIEERGRHHDALSGKEKTEEVDGIESPKGNDVIFYHLHSAYKYLYFPE